jgi:surfactin synthase thioesterase subunit
LDLFHSYKHRNRDPLPCPITVFGGMQDPNLPRHILELWRGETSSEFSLRLFLGGHFYHQENPDLFLKVLTRKLNPLTATSGVRR